MIPLIPHFFNKENKIKTVGKYKKSKKWGIRRIRRITEHVLYYTFQTRFLQEHSKSILKLLMFDSSCCRIQKNLFKFISKA